MWQLQRVYVELQPHLVLFLTGALSNQPDKQTNIILLCQTQWKKEVGFNRTHLLFSFPHCLLCSPTSQPACWTLASGLPTVSLVKPALYGELSERFYVYMKSVHSSLQLPKPGTVLNFWSIKKREVCVPHFETHLLVWDSQLFTDSILLLQVVKHYLAKKP